MSSYNILVLTTLAVVAALYFIFLFLGQRLENKPARLDLKEDLKDVARLRLLRKLRRGMIAIAIGLAVRSAVRIITGI